MRSAALLVGLATISSVLVSAGSVMASPDWVANPHLVSAQAALVESDKLGPGVSVSLSGNGRTAVVGFPKTLRDRGAVAVYTRSGQAWSVVKSFTSSVDGARFGTSVGVSTDGRTVLVGAPGAADGKGEAWVYRSANGGVWVGSRLPVKGATAKSAVGDAVGLSADGRRAVVGAPGDDKEKGAVFMFGRSTTTWRQAGGKITGAGEIGRGRFGDSVAMAYEGETAVVGGPKHERGRGAVWVYTRRGSVWKLQSRIEEGIGEKTYFGSRLAVSADGYTVIVGAPDTNDRRGAAWSFRRSGSKWSTSQIGLGPIQPDENLEPRSYRGIGAAVALSPDGLTAVVVSGLMKNRVIVDGQGWLLKWSGASWVPVESLDVTSSSRDSALSYAGDIALVGSDEFTQVFSPTPSAVGLNPEFGPLAGGTEVAITGSNFVKVRSVRFGSTAAASFTVDSPSAIRAVSPPGQAGTIHVTVVNAYGTSPPRTRGFFGGASTLFTYLGPPAVTGVAPNSGPPAGGTQVTISGTGFSGTTAVRFGGTGAASFTVNSATRITAVAPPAAAGAVNITVTTPYGTSAVNESARFTYVSPATVIGFDNITTGGPGQTLVPVASQYAAQGMTFNSPWAVDYSKGSAIAGFARSGTVAIEHCVGVEFCTTPIVGTFSTPKSMARVWVGFSFQLNQPILVQLRAYDAGGTIIDSDAATLPARPTPTPIGIPLEVNLPSATIARIEVSVSGGFNNALAVDDVTFEG